MTGPTAATAPASTAGRRRPPAPVVAATVITGIRMGFGCFGFVYFGVFVSTDVNPAAGSPSAVGFAAVGLVFVLTALAGLPGLWRGHRTAWHVLTSVLAALVLFSSYKVLVEGETDSAVFLAVDLMVAALLLLPATRRHVGA